jgi:hypothetical protein
VEENVAAVSGRLEGFDREIAVRELLLGAGGDADSPQMSRLEVLLERKQIVSEPIAFALGRCRRIACDEVDRKALGRPEAATRWWRVE